MAGEANRRISSCFASEAVGARNLPAVADRNLSACRRQVFDPSRSHLNFQPFLHRAVPQKYPQPFEPKHANLVQLYLIPLVLPILHSKISHDIAPRPHTESRTGAGQSHTHLSSPTPPQNHRSIPAYLPSSQRPTHSCALRPKSASLFSTTCALFIALTNTQLHSPQHFMDSWAQKVGVFSAHPNQA